MKRTWVILGLLVALVLTVGSARRRGGQNYKAGAPTLEYQTGLTLWHKADAITGKSDGDSLSQWDDSSGNDYHATQGTADYQPTYKTGILNGLPVVRFGATYTNYFNLSNVLSGFTAVEVFVVVEMDADPSGAGSGGLWRIDSQGSKSHVPYTDGTVYDAFGSNARKTAGNPTPTLAAWRLYNVSSESGAWTNRIDAVDFYGTGSNSVGINTDPVLGVTTDTATYAECDIAEFLIYDHVLTPANRATVETYLDDKYDLF